MKLLDDLLDDEPSPKPQDQKKSEPPKPASSSDPTEPLDFDISEVVKVREEEPPKSPEDQTLRLSESKISAQPIQATNRFTTGKQKVIPDAPAETKAAVGRYSPLKSGGFSSAAEASLATSENLRIAQNRILELEQEISRLRTDNEQLAAAGETLRRRADELAAEAQSLREKLERTVENKDQEIELLKAAFQQKDKDTTNYKMKVEELEMRLSTNIQKIRVRERELENRLELAKMEGSALVRSKDEIILDLKRQLDQANLELENYRNKGQELNRQINDKQEMLRRTVKALRIALSMLEGDEEAQALKKVK